MLNFWLHYVILVCVLGSEGWMTKGGGSYVWFAPGKFELVLLAIGKWKQPNPTGHWRKDILAEEHFKKLMHSKHPASCIIQKQGTEPAFFSGYIQYTLQISFSFLKLLLLTSMQSWIRLQADESWKQKNSWKSRQRLLLRKHFSMPILSPKWLKFYC